MIKMFFPYLILIIEGQKCHLESVHSFVGLFASFEVTAAHICGKDGRRMGLSTPVITQP